jgi:hypothetical protein
VAEVVITTRVNNELVEKTVNNFKDLKKEIRASKDELLKYAEGSDDFKRVQRNVSELQSAVKGLGDTARIEGSGVERLQRSFDLLGEGFLSGDLEKGKIALTGIGQAVKAIPIFLLVEGVMFLIQNFDKVLEFIPGLQVIVDTFNDLTDAIGLTNHAQNKLYDDNIAKSKQATDAVVSFYDKEIALLKASGQETFLLEQQKRIEFRATLDAQAKVIQDRALLDKKLTAEQLKQLEELDKAQKQSLLESEVAEIEYGIKIQKERDDRYNDQKKKREELEKERLKKLAEDEANFQIAIEKAYERQDKEVEVELARRQKIEDIQRAADDRDFKNRIAATKENLRIKADEARAEEELTRKKELLKQQITNSYLNSANNLTKAYFQSQLNQVKGNADEELKIRKKQFEVEKAFNLARAIIDGIRAVQATLEIPPLAIANGIAAAANVALIASTQFNEGQTAASAPSVEVGGGATIQPTTSAAPISQFGEGSGQLLNGGNNEINQRNAPLTVRAYVVESEITQSQSTVSKEKRTSTFG